MYRADNPMLRILFLFETIYVSRINRIRVSINAEEKNRYVFTLTNDLDIYFIVSQKPRLASPLFLSSI